MVWLVFCSGLLIWVWIQTFLLILGVVKDPPPPRSSFLPCSGSKYCCFASPWTNWWGVWMSDGDELLSGSHRAVPGLGTGRQNSGWTRDELKSEARNRIWIALLGIILQGAKAVRGWSYFAVCCVVGAVLHISPSSSSSQFFAGFILNWGNWGKQNNLVQIIMGRF